MNEVERPPLVVRCHERRRFASPKCDTSLQTLSDLKMRRSINAINALVICDDPVAPQEHVQTTISESPTLRRELLKACFQVIIVWSLQYTAKCFRMTRCDVASSALAKPNISNDRLSSTSSLRRR